MALSTVTKLDRIEIDSDGNVLVRLLKQVLSEAGDVMFSEPHRVSFPPGTTVKDQMAMANTHLEQMGFPSVEAKATDLVASHAALASRT